MPLFSAATKTAVAGLMLALAVDASAALVVRSPVVVRHRSYWRHHHYYPRHRHLVVRSPVVIRHIR